MELEGVVGMIAILLALWLGEIGERNRRVDQPRRLDARERARAEVISEYEIFDVKTSQPIQVRLFPTCATAGCLKPCEPKSRQCRDCAEQAKRIEMRLAMEPRAIASF